jgi:hypothetical protein
MKAFKLNSAIGLILATLALTATANQPEIGMYWRHLLPAKSEDWSSAEAFETQLRFWNPNGWGLALSIGVEDWEAKDDFYSEGDGRSYFSTAVTGSLTAIPAGISVMHRRQISDGLFLTFDAGLRYVFCESDMSVQTEVNDSLGHDFYNDPIQTDNAVLAVFGIMFEGWIGNEVSIQGGFGYQIDLVELKETFQGKDIGSTSLDAACFRLGIAWTF